MKLRNFSAGLVAVFTLLSGAAEAKSLLSYLQLNPQQEQSDYRPGALRQGEALALYSVQQRKTSFEACADQFPSHRPLSLSNVSAALKPLALCSDNFAVLYSQTSKTPLVVTERLNAAQLRDAKDEERTNQFYPDPRIPKEGRAELSDYRHAAVPVDRGHQFPAADAPSPNAMAQSFALSNMVPQDAKSNRGAWRRIETDVRKFVRRARGDVFVFTGPIFDPGHSTVGDNKVWKPTRLFKLVYDEASGRAWAYILPNAESQVARPVDYATFVKETGLRLLEGVTVTGTAGRS